jgi:hypothetical protein
LVNRTLNEYIRRRRLTLAGYELRDTRNKVIDIAIKYNFNSVDAFTKAFTKQHGITPINARLPENPLKIYPPISFYILDFIGIMVIFLPVNCPTMFMWVQDRINLPPYHQMAKRFLMGRGAV